MSFDLESFPSRLRQYRELNRLTQRQLGERWNVSPETISAWEHGRRKPDVSLVPKLASALGMEEGELIRYIHDSGVKLREGESREVDPNGLVQNSSSRMFRNQEDCESYIMEASQHTRKVKVLTIRGDKYFVGTKSLFHSIIAKRNIPIEILVLSPTASHITDELAEKLEHSSAEEIRERMRIALRHLKYLAEVYENFNVKCYNRKPIFKILIFDEVMFVSSFAQQMPRNDRNAEMLMIQQNNALFAGFEEFYSELLRNAFSPD